MRRNKIIFLWVIFILVPAGSLFSHGSEYSILSDNIMKIETRYDTGEFLKQADVLVFPPGEKESAYTLRTDNEGCFYFQPDREGVWILQVRGEEGHGMRINLPVDKSMTSSGSRTNRLSILQKLLMVLCVLWGSAGTVLYFKNRF